VQIAEMLFCKKLHYWEEKTYSRMKKRKEREIEFCGGGFVDAKLKWSLLPRAASEQDNSAGWGLC
jgi:hypothetical protein